MLPELQEFQDDQLLQDGVLHSAGMLEASDLKRALDEVLKFYYSALEQGMFFSEDEARERGLFSEGGGPRRRVERADNLMYSDLGWFQSSASFKRLTRVMSAYIGPDLDMFLGRVIVTMPLKDIPAYIRDRFLPIDNRVDGSLNRFIRDPFLRAFFFIHNPWHQDWVDLAESDLRFMTVLLPLTNRRGGQAPLYVLPRSAAVEPQSLPIRLEDTGGEVKLLDGPVGRTFEKRRVEAGPGDLIAWSARTFHMVDVNTADEPAINLRFNFCPRDSRTGLKDISNLVPVSRSVLTRLVEGGPRHPEAPGFVPTPDVMPPVARPQVKA